MGVYSSSEEMWQVIGTLWERIKADPDMSRQLLNSKLIVQFRYRNPEWILTIDCSDGQEMHIINGPGSNKPVIEMSMKSDVAHEFWMGRISVPVAILTGKIVSRGPTPKALALLPVIRPAFPLYPMILEEAGKNALLSK